MERSIFLKMLSSGALNKAHPYLTEERKALEACLRNNRKIRDMSFCAIGGGSFQYLELGLQYAKEYVLVEPFLTENKSEATPPPQDFL